MAESSEQRDRQNDQQQGPEGTGRPADAQAPEPADRPSIGPEDAPGQPDAASAGSESPAPEEEQPRVWKCGRCRCDLVTKKVELEYMGYTISHDLPTCPTCGKVYISKDLAEGRMCEVEQTLEDK